MKLFDKIYYLSEIIGMKIILNDKKIGKCIDLTIIDRGKFAEITNIYIARPFGEKYLLIPWEKVKKIEKKEIYIEIEHIQKYESEPEEGQVLLQDHIIDKKVLDVEDREVEVVYDLRLVLRNNRLYVFDVDLSKYGLLRRIGLKFVADFFYKFVEKISQQTVGWDYIELLPNKISSFKGDIKLKVLKETLTEMPPVDLADILEELEHEQRVAIFAELDPEHASDTLEELDPKVQRDMIASLKKERAAELINKMSPAQAADVLSVLPWFEAKSLLKLLKKSHAEKINSILEAQEQNIKDFVISEFIEFSPDKTVEQAKDEYQKLAKGKDVIMYLYIVDDTKELLGVIDIKELLQAEDNVPLKEVMTEQVVSLEPEDNLKKASELFGRYGFRALPVVDQDKKILGVIPYRDVMNLKHFFV
jgi:CBS domain-containing protein